MKKRFFLFLLAGLFLALLSSCTSVPYSMWKSSANKVVTLVNSDGSAYLAELTKSPFLFDREIIILERDIEMIWKNIDDAGFVFQKGYEVESVPLSPGDYSYFGDTMEVRTWFEKYLPEKASLVKIQAPNGLYYFILGGRKWIRIEEEASPVSFGIYRRSRNFAFGISAGREEDTTVKKTFPVIYGFAGPVEGGR